MAWLEMRCTCEEHSTDALGDALMAHGALSVSVEDADAGSGAERPIFGEPGAALGRVWKRNSVIALFEQGVDCQVALASACADCALPMPDFETHLLDDEDWVRKTQSQFAPIRISSRMWIVPTWHTAPDPQAIAIRLDPGLAFGTGSHPTTRLCLSWLDAQSLAGRSVLDYGCGSGILAIAASRLGAQQVYATDIDPQALDAARANAAANECVIDTLDIDKTATLRTDIVVANILTNPLKVLAPVLTGHLALGGCLILSGILVSQEEEVIAAYSPLIKLEPFAHDDGWTCLGGRLGA